MPNFVSVAPLIAELAHGEKLDTQSLTHAAYLVCREPKLVALEYMQKYINIFQAL